MLLARAVRVIALSAEASSARWGLESPFVGRLAARCDSIKDLFHASADEAAGAPGVGASESAGIGKSRLSWGVSGSTIDGLMGLGVVASRPLPRLRRGHHVLGALVGEVVLGAELAASRTSRAEVAGPQRLEPAVELSGSPTPRSVGGWSPGSPICSGSRSARRGRATTCLRDGAYSSSASLTGEARR